MPAISSQSSSLPAPEPSPARENGNCSPPIVGNDRGITLLELLITLGIVAILMSIAAQLYMGALERARVTRAKADIRIIEKLIAPRLLDGVDLPATLDDLEWQNLDPWGQPYVFKNFDFDVPDGDPDEPDGFPADARRDEFHKPVNTRYDLYSMGRDGTSDPRLTAAESLDDVLRASDGVFVGLATDY